MLKAHVWIPVFIIGVMASGWCLLSSEGVGPGPSIPSPFFRRTATRGVSGSMERTLTASSGSIAMVTRRASCLGVEVSGPVVDEVLGFGGRSRISACCDRTHGPSEPESPVAEVGWTTRFEGTAS